MKTENLMHYDWVYCDGEPIQVFVYGESICTPAGGERKAYRLEPIPLTPEILKKNGFYKGAKGSENREEFTYIKYVDNDVLVAFSIRVIFFPTWILSECCDYNNKGKFFKGEISYVHDLQHCLNLVGIEKEITVI